MKKNPPRGMDRRTFLKAGSAMSLGAVATFSASGDISAKPDPQIMEKNVGEMIDMFPHIQPAKYNKALLKKAKPCYYIEANRIRPALANLDERFKFLGLALEHHISAERQMMRHVAAVAID